MFLYWKIPYLDRADNRFKDRNLRLDTASLAPAAGAAIELVAERRAAAPNREILKFRGYFTDAQGHFELPRLGKGKPPRMKSFFLHDYFEDERGNEISPDEVARASSGNPNARLANGLGSHYHEFVSAEPKPMPVAEISLSAEDLATLGYFARDNRELSASAFFADGPGTFSWSPSITSPGGIEPAVKTGASDEEIRSFATIFRCLYMKGEPGCFLSAVRVFADAVGDIPVGKLARGIGKEYEDLLSNTRFWPPPTKRPTTFSSQDLIDVFLNTWYVHHPNRRRKRDYDDYLLQVDGQKGLLFWLFLNSIWKCGLAIHNAGVIINGWFDCYCKHHGHLPGAFAQLRDEQPGVGSQEKQRDREDRLFRERAEALASGMWKREGCPVGGPSLFLPTAERELRQLLDGGSDAEV